MKPTREQDRGIGAEMAIGLHDDGRPCRFTGA
jgi:hypothetical protein